MTVVTDTKFLLSLSDSVSQREWIRTYANAPNPSLVDALREQILKIGLDNPHSALKISELLRELADHWDDDAAEAAYMHTYADTLCMTGNHSEALNLFKKATALYEAIGNSEKAVHVAAGHIIALHATSRYDDAIALVQTMRPKAEALKAHLTEGKMLVNIGNVYAELGQFAEAQAHYRSAHAAYEQADDVPVRLLATLALSEAIALMSLNRFAESEIQLMSARDKFDELEMMIGVAYVNLNLMTLYHAQGDYQKALYTAAIARDQFPPGSIETAFIDLQRCPTYMHLTLWDEALEAARLARPLFEETDNKWRYATTWLNEGIALAQKSVFDESIPALLEAEGAYEAAGNSSWVAIAKLYRASAHHRRSENDIALRLAQSAKQLFDEHDYPGFAIRCLLLMGDIALAKHDYAAAHTHFHDALTLQEQSGFTATRYACYIGLAKKMERGDGDKGRAIALYERAICDIEQLQANIGEEGYKMAFLRDKTVPYERLVDLLLDDGEVERAFAIAERSKSRVLLDVMRHRQTMQRAEHAPDLLGQFDTAQRELHWFYSRLNEPDRDHKRTPAEMQALNAQIREKEQTVNRLRKKLDAPEFATATSNPTWTVKAADLLKQIPAGTTLITQFTIGNNIIAFTLSDGVIRATRVTMTVDDVADLLAQLRFQMNKFSYGAQYVERHSARLLQSSQDVLGALYDGLIRPLNINTNDTNSKTDNLIIVPHNVLHYIPFHALFDGDAYLIDNCAVSTVPSGTVLYQTSEKSGMENTSSVAEPLIIGLADETIPHTETETRAIAQFFPDCDLYLGEEATLATLQFTQPPAFLHLSTHALFRTDNPGFSALKLTDGWFTVYDVAQLAQSPPLVTLSGCETGRVNAAAGDELVGLSRGFFATGTQSLIMSLWMVEDGSTAALMTTLYAALRQEQTVQHALRQAQLETKAHHPHPYYWASFTLSGSPHTRLQRKYEG